MTTIPTAEQIAKMKSELKNLNVANLTEQTSKSNSIWKPEFLKSLNKKSDTSARSTARKMQLKFSKRLLHAVLVSSDSKEIVKAKNDLFDFYSKSLVSFENYSNRSKDQENKKKVEERQIIDKAYNTMKKLS